VGPVPVSTTWQLPPSVVKKLKHELTFDDEALNKTVIISLFYLKIKYIIKINCVFIIKKYEKVVFVSSLFMRSTQALQMSPALSSEFLKK
jgi:hypothetical protein